MIDPVTAPDGYTYERASITKWIKEEGTSPLDPSLTLDNRTLNPARAIFAAIIELVESGDLDEGMSTSWKIAKQEANLEKARQLLRNGHVLDAAKLGLLKAQANMAVRYLKGSDGVKKDLPLFVEWASKAAEGGDKQGQDLLGFAHHKGLGVAKNLIVVLNWF